MIKIDNTNRFEYMNNSIEETGEYLGVCIYDKRQDILFPLTGDTNYELIFRDFVNGGSFMLRKKEKDGFVDLDKLYKIRFEPVVTEISE